MTDKNQSGQVRHPDPAAAAQDPHDATVQAQTHSDGRAIQSHPDPVTATTPAILRDKTVEEIAEEAERRAAQ